MTENQYVLQTRLEKLLTRKKSKKYYAYKLGIEEEEVDNLLKGIKQRSEAIADAAAMSEYAVDLENTIVKLEEDLKNSRAELTANVSEEIKTLDELIDKCKIDTSKWNIDRYVQNFWGNGTTPRWQVKAYLSLKTKEENFQKDFLSFLATYKPQIEQVPDPSDWDYITPRTCLVINKQDEHLNKFDINGSNSIEERFRTCYTKMNEILLVASNVNYIEKIVYIIGSDQFNSEWTGLTTKGTPQTNLLPYHDAFEKICNYELRMIQALKKYSNDITILYIPGNHDEFVGWHLIHWLKAMYSQDDWIKFDIRTDYTKLVKYGNSIMMFNHGDTIKPEKLAAQFPVLARDVWSQCTNYYIFTGDKHHEVSRDYNGVMFYQLPALSTAKSNWDSKMGHTCSKAELTAFMIDENEGINTIYKKRL